MIYSEFINSLYDKLGNDLPGIEAHKIMAPYRQSVSSYFEKKRPEPKLSAVMILFYPIDYVPHFCLMQRPVYDGTHSGQVSFPGGKMEDVDFNLKETAIRETKEEVGIDNIQVLGQLSDIYIPPSNFLVSPFIGMLDSKPAFIPDEREVADILEVPFFDILDERIVKQTQIKVSSGIKIKTPFYDIQNRVVWGATAAILAELKVVWKGIE